MDGADGVGEAGEAGDWSAALAGDGEAFGRVYDRHRARVVRHATRLVDTPAEVEDVLATAFLELWRRRRDVRLVDGSVLPWLLATTTFCSANVRRSTIRYRRLLARLPRIDERATGEARDPADVVSAAEVDPALLDALGELDPLDRQLVTLVALEGYRVTDAAARLGISATAARSRLSRARRRVRELIGSEQAHRERIGRGAEET